MEKENKCPTKTKEEILEQLYLSAYDLKELMPTLSYMKALSYIKGAREEMREKNIFVPNGKTKIALTKIIRKKFGF